MERYEECRKEAVRHLDIHLLFEKIRFFEQVTHVVLEDYHRIGINLLEKPRISEMKKNRKGYLLREQLYFQLDQLKRKG